MVQPLSRRCNNDAPTVLRTRAVRVNAPSSAVNGMYFMTDQWSRPRVSAIDYGYTKYNGVSENHRAGVSDDFIYTSHGSLPVKWTPQNGMKEHEPDFDSRPDFRVLTFPKRADTFPFPKHHTGRVKMFASVLPPVLTSSANGFLCRIERPLSYSQISQALILSFCPLFDMPPWRIAQIFQATRRNTTDVMLTYFAKYNGRSYWCVYDLHVVHSTRTRQHWMRKRAAPYSSSRARKRRAKGREFFALRKSLNFATCFGDHVRGTRYSIPVKDASEPRTPHPSMSNSVPRASESLECVVSRLKQGQARTRVQVRSALSAEFPITGGFRTHPEPNIGPFTARLLILRASIKVVNFEYFVPVRLRTIRYQLSRIWPGAEMIFYRRTVPQFQVVAWVSRIGRSLRTNPRRLPPSRNVPFRTDIPIQNITQYEPRARGKEKAPNFVHYTGDNGSTRSVGPFLVLNPEYGVLNSYSLAEELFPEKNRLSTLHFTGCREYVTMTFSHTLEGEYLKLRSPLWTMDLTQLIFTVVASAKVNLRLFCVCHNPDTSRDAQKSERVASVNLSSPPCDLIISYLRRLNTNRLCLDSFRLISADFVFCKNDRFTIIDTGDTATHHGARQKSEWNKGWADLELLSQRKSRYPYSVQQSRDQPPNIS
ncbi:hypothetical protein ACRALDRAFT_211210 [Sodiomyces alcalophilus JCM 7366]|uniref:uncharacterized protein n=1 Tax=Sodiomyces alcalophilus JCM 7366 TaxID=591952 RepID=UPI0039B41501